MEISCKCCMLPSSPRQTRSQSLLSEITTTQWQLPILMVNHTSLDISHWQLRCCINTKTSQTVETRNWSKINSWIKFTSMLKLVQLRRIWYIQNMTELDQTIITEAHAFLGHANSASNYWILPYILVELWPTLPKKLIISSPEQCLAVCVCVKFGTDCSWTVTCTVAAHTHTQTRN